MNNITPDMARAELARRELMRRRSLNQESENPDIQLSMIQQKHPYLVKLAESLSGNKALESAGNIAGHFNRAVEGTGLPSVAKGFLGTGIEAGRGLANLIPGINVPKQDYAELNVNPYVGQGAEILGEGLAGFPLYKGYQGTKALLEAIPYAKNLPQAARSLLVGTSAGAALSPENRVAGGVLGGAAEAVPLAANAIKNLKPNAFKAIQEGYDTKLKKLTGMFEDVGKDVAQKGIKQIKVPNSFFAELEEIGPQSKTFKRFVNNAKKGSYEDLRKLNTELFKRGTKYSSSPFPSDVERAEDIFAQRDTLNNIISKALHHSGLEESAHKLSKAMGGYKSLKDTYTANPRIAKLVGPNRLIPSKSTVLKENSEFMKNLKMQHPEIDKQLKYESNLKKALGVAGGITALGGVKPILQYIKE